MWLFGAHLTHYFGLLGPDADRGGPQRPGGPGRPSEARVHEVRVGDYLHKIRCKPTNEHKKAIGHTLVQVDVAVASEAPLGGSFAPPEGRFPPSGSSFLAPEAHLGAHARQRPPQEPLAKYRAPTKRCLEKSGSPKKVV